MKKAIHIAGFTIGVIVLYALAIAALAQNAPPRVQNVTHKWRRATYKECSDEAHRELAETGKEGIIGDAPITFGSADGTVGIEGWSYDPCGYADNSNPPHFKARYTHWTSGGKETEITEEEYQKHEGEDDLQAQPPPQNVQSAPFDVPAVATSVEIYQDSSRCYPISNTEVSCPPMPVKTIFTCTDKSRFLLFSEDGKAHCLKLVPHD